MSLSRFPVPPVLADDFKLIVKYNELAPLQSDPEWEDAEFYYKPNSNWLPQNLPTDPREGFSEIYERCNEVLRKETKLPLHLNDMFTVPIQYRKEPLFIVCSPRTMTPGLVLPKNNGCQYCGANPERKVNHPSKTCTELCFVFPIPWASLPKVPSDVDKLPGNLIYVVCKNCLEEQFALTEFYAYRGTSCGAHSIKVRITTLDYLPYKRIFGVSIMAEIANLTKSKHYVWQLRIPEDSTNLPILHGIYTTRQRLTCKRAIQDE